MAKQFEIKIPSEVLEEFRKKCTHWANSYLDDNESDLNLSDFANLCATWGANQEYQKSYEFVDDAWGSDHAEEYQKYRRPKILSKKEEALEAMNYIDSIAVSNMRSYTCYDKLKESVENIIELIDSIPDEDT